MSKNDYKWWFELILALGLVVLISVITDSVNSLIIGVAIPLIWALFFLVFKEATGVFLGILLIVGIVYLLIVRNELVVSILQTTKLISVLGLWLGGSGFLGKARLQKWERNFVNKDPSTSNISSRLADFIRKASMSLLEVTGGPVGWIFLFIIGAFISVWFLLIPLALTFYFLLYVIFQPVLEYVIAVPVFVFLFPYKIASHLDNEMKIERALILSGLILGTIGLIFGV